MIETIIELSIRNRFLVILITMALTALGIYAAYDTPVDAIPDLSENQVIVFTDWMGRSPREIEDQVTYPLSRKLQGLAGVRAVRSSSEFNFSMITIIFEDNIDFYFARQRVTEKLAQANTFLPEGVLPYMAPDATALGQIFWYTVEPSPAHPIDPPKLWALNKFYIGPQLNAAQGVADVAIVGGMPVEYQVDVRPEDLRAYGITLGDLYSAVSKSNMPAGGGVVQKNNAEYIVRGVGWIRDKRDIENTVIKEVEGTPIYVRNVADVGLGTQFRRSVYEKDGSEVTGGAVLMRHGENPLAVTKAVKQKFIELQPGLPEGLRIVPAYDRTRLIHGAIDTLTKVMWHEMLIASLAILLILFHFRSVFVICITLPLAVLFSFLLMWVLRQLGIIDIQANIMSLAGITISIGILVDQAIVIVENATHHLKAKFGDAKVAGDITEEVIGPCRTVGRPIFFSVMIMLLSFVPVFLLSGREGKYFHPLAFTKSFAMIGVALISITLVPALIPTFIKGRLRSEEDNPIVRSFINIYKPLLTWALPRRNLVMWAFAVLLILAAGMFPLQAIIGQGASETAWRTAFLGVLAMVIGITVLSTMGRRGHDFLFLMVASLIIALAAGFAWIAPELDFFAVHLPMIYAPLPGSVAVYPLKLLAYAGTLLCFVLLAVAFILAPRKVIWPTVSFMSLILIGLWAYHFPKIGVAFMPALDEGTLLDMPITVPRASVTQVADDLKARDALLRGFPEVESVIGKAGRSETPTDPAPLDMVETFVNFRSKEFWPKRVLKYTDAVKQIRVILGELEFRGFVRNGVVEEEKRPLRTNDAASVRTKRQRIQAALDDRSNLVNQATQKAIERFDETMRELALSRYGEIERELRDILPRFAVTETIERFERAGDVRWSDKDNRQEVVDHLIAQVTPEYGYWLARQPSLEDVTRLTQQVANYMSERDAFRHRYEIDKVSLDALTTQKVSDPTLKTLKAMEGEKFPQRADFLNRLRKVLSEMELQKHESQILRQADKALTAADALAINAGSVREMIAALGESLSGKPTTFFDVVLHAVETERMVLWRARVHQVNWELHDLGVEAFDAYAIAELVTAAKSAGLLRGAKRGKESQAFAKAALDVQLGKRDARRKGSANSQSQAQGLQPLGLTSVSDQSGDATSPHRVAPVNPLNHFNQLRAQLDPAFSDRVFFRPRQSGPKGDLVDDEMGRVLQVPGWSNIFTQPIINRIEMLSTGVRTDIGVKVFGPDLDTIVAVGKRIEVALKPISGARDVIANQIMGKGYLEIDIDREAAARYGISVEDIQNEIEVALAGRAVTFTVEKRERFPVRIRYARVNREDEESIRRLLISAGGMSGSSTSTGAGPSSPVSPTMTADSTSGKNGLVEPSQHTAAPKHAVGRPLIPLGALADVRVVEGPAMIKSENGRLLNYVTLNVRGRDIVGFVDEAQRAVAEKVKLPEGVHIEWSGEFEHQVRAARTLRFVFPAVILLIFVILYLTYKDLTDAALMMLAVPEALAGGAFFMYLFPKFMQGWSAPPMDFSVAVWVGFIACFGMATETGIIMLVYLREAIDKRGGLENIASLEELRQAVIEGAVHRLRPKLLTEGVAIIAIFPMLFAKGVGGEILAPMALPVLGGLLISDEVVDLFLPVRFYWVRRARWLKLQEHS